MALAVSAPVGYVPLIPFAPVQPATPEPVHAVAWVELHDSVEALPLGIAAGFAMRIAVGMMLTVVVAGAAVPPEPLQVREKAAEVDNVPLLCVPLVPFGPLQPPDAVHAVALVEFHVKVTLPPLLTDVGIALKEAVGGGGDGVTGTDPDPPQAAKTSAPAATKAVFNDRMTITRSPSILMASGGGKSRIHEAISPRAMKDIHDIISTHLQPRG